MNIHSINLEINIINPSAYTAVVKVYRQTPGFMVEISGQKPEKIDLSMVEEEACEAAAHGALYCGIYLRVTNELIGVTTFERSNYAGKKDTAWIALLMIAEPRQKSGYGAEAYRMIEEFIFSNPAVRKIELGVLPNNHQAKLFWYKMGYEMIEPENGKQRDDILRMRKSAN